MDENNATQGIKLALDGIIGGSIPIPFFFFGFIFLVIVIVLVSRVSARVGKVMSQREEETLPLSDIVWVVRNFRDRTEQKGSAKGYTETPDIIWTFNLERINPATGDQLPPVPVEMRGETFDGFINDGDKIQLYGTWQEGTMCRTRRVRNISKGEDVRARFVF